MTEELPQAGIRDLRQEAQRAALRYRRVSRFAEGFAKGKMSADPVYAQVLDLLPAQGMLLDAGCGEGYLLALVRQRLPSPRRAGVDHDERRVDLARKALQGEERLELQVGDLRQLPLGQADAVTCLDVLHYMAPQQQDELLARLAACVRPGGLLLVRDGESGAGLRSFLTGLSERLAVAMGRHKGDGVFFRPAEQTQAQLEAQGLQVEVRPCQQGTPFANIVFIARRPEAA